MLPRFSVIEFTTPRLSFAEDLEVYARAGADAVGIAERKLGDDRKDLEHFRASDLLASSVFPAIGSILPRPGQGETDPAQRVELLEQSIHRLAPFGAPYCSVVPGPYGRWGEAEAVDLVVAACRKLAAVATDEGMKLVLELMHPSLFDEFSFMTTIPAATRLLDAIGSSQVGLALDTWHLDEADADLLVQVRDCASRVASVHVNDRRVPTRSWCDRVLPGDGSIDLVGILSSLEDGGFDDWFELEVVSDDGSVAEDFPDSLWRSDPFEFVSAGRTQFLSLWERRRSSAGDRSAPDDRR